MIIILKTVIKTIQLNNIKVTWAGYNWGIIFDYMFFCRINLTRTENAMLAAAKKRLCYSEFTKSNTSLVAHQSRASRASVVYSHQLTSRFALFSIKLQALRPALQLKERPVEVARQGETVDYFNLKNKAQNT